MKCSFRADRGRARLAPPWPLQALGRLASAVGSSAALALAPGDWTALAQVALPEQRVTYPNAYQLSNPVRTYQGGPDLSASGRRVLGVWLDDKAAPGTFLGVGHVNDAPNEWIGNVPLDPAPFINLLGTYAPFVHRTGTAGILLGVRSHSFYSSPQLHLEEFHRVTTAWRAPIEVNGEDFESMAFDPAANVVYATLTAKTGEYPILNYYIYLLRSPDGGLSWEPPVTLSSAESDVSTVLVGPEGEVYVAWLDYQQGMLVGRKSTDHGLSFSPEFGIGAPAENFGAAPKGWVAPPSIDIRYNPFHTYGSFFYAPNYPKLAVDLSQGPTRGRLYAVWAERATGTLAPAAQVVSEIEDNGSLSTAHVLAMNTDVHGYLPGYEDVGVTDFDIFAFDGEAGQLVYLHGDLTGDGYSSPESPTPAWVLYGTRSNGVVEGIYRGSMMRQWQGSIQPSYISLPRTGRYYIALDQDSRSLSYVLRLRAFQPEPGSASLDMRDIVITHSSDGGQSWTSPRRVNHGPGDSDQHMPNVAVDERGRVYVAWYDRRGFELGDSVHACAAVSTDGGLTFGADMRLSRVASYWSGDHSAGGFGNWIGDRIAVAAGENFGVVAWSDFRDSLNGGGTDPNVYSAWIVDPPVAVTDISDFGAEPVPEGIRLRWLVHDARAIAGVRVHRGEAGVDELPLGTEDLAVRAAGAGEFLDNTAEPGRAYRYRLRIARGASADWLGPVEAVRPPDIANLGWRGARPNPFAESTELRLAVPARARGAVRVYDLSGKAVRTLKEGAFEPGEATLNWDGRDANGRAAPPGVYFLDAHVGGEAVRLKLARIR